MGQHLRHATNVAEARDIIKDLGGKLTEILGAKRHLRIRVVTQKGNSLVINLSKAKSDPYKLRGWIRQQFNRADAVIASNRRTQRDQV